MRNKNMSKIGMVGIVLAMSAFGSPLVAADGPGSGVKVSACTSTSIEGLFHQLIPAMGLEELGYEVKAPLTLSVPAMHQAISSGDCDYAVDHWVPLHNSFYDPIKDRVTRVGATILSAGQGYLIDKATADAHNISTLSDFKKSEIAVLFDTDGNGKANLAGANPGWGSELVINHELDTIGLRDTVDHDQGEYTAIIADTMARFRRGESVLLYTWLPNWLLGELLPGEKSIWLTVDASFCPPEQACGNSTTGFPLNDISTIANNDFLAANPAAQSFLGAVQIPIADINAQNFRLRDGEDSEADVARHAQEWIDDHRSEFDAWIAAAKEAAS